MALFMQKMGQQKMGQQKAGQQKAGQQTDAREKENGRRLWRRPSNQS
jgi:hypothetical protein